MYKKQPWGIVVIGSEEDLQIFVDLGLTLLQAKIYLSLVGSGRANVKRISQVTRVSRPDIYRSIYKLQDLGLIEQEITKPVIFKAVSITQAIDFLLNRQKIKHGDLEKRGKKFVEKFAFDDNETLGEDAKLILVPSQESLINKLKKAIDNTQLSIDVITSMNRFKQACYLLPESLQRAWKRNVKGRALVEVSEKEQIDFIKEVWMSPAAQLKYLNHMPDTIMAMYDKKEVFIFTKTSENLRDSPALWTDNPGIVAMAKNYFETLWSTSMENSKYNLDNP